MMNSIASSSVSTSKLPFLDGIRGLMALNVVISHFVIVFFPQMLLQEFADSMGGTLSLFAGTPLSVLVNGNIAVQYFFVLTGFLVGRTFFTNCIGCNQILKRSINRYLRLLPVVFFTTVFTYLTMRLGLQWHLSINELLYNQNFLPYFCNFEPTFANLLINIFVYPFIRSSAYVGPFWTIRYEFFGYILSMLVCHLFQENRFRRIGYIITAVLCFSQLSPNYTPFIFGVFIADLKYNHAPDFLDKFFDIFVRQPVFIFSSLLIGLYFACCPLYFSTIYSPLDWIPKVTPDLVRSIGVALVLHALLYLPKIQDFFSHGIFLFLGRISFSIYAIHWPLMLSMQYWLFSVLIKVCTYTSAAVISFLICLPVILFSAYLMWRFVEKNHFFGIQTLTKWIVPSKMIQK